MLTVLLIAYLVVVLPFAVLVGKGIARGARSEAAVAVPLTVGSAAGALGEDVTQQADPATPLQRGRHQGSSRRRSRVDRRDRQAGTAPRPSTSASSASTMSAYDVVR